MQNNSNKSLQVITLTADRLSELMERSARLGAMLALKDAGVCVSEYKTRAELDRMYGKRVVSAAISRGLTPRKIGERIKYSTIEFNSLIII